MLILYVDVSAEALRPGRSIAILALCLTNSYPSILISVFLTGNRYFSYQVLLIHVKSACRKYARNLLFLLFLHCHVPHQMLCCEGRTLIYNPITSVQAALDEASCKDMVRYGDLRWRFSLMFAIHGNECSWFTYSDHLWAWRTSSGVAFEANSRRFMSSSTVLYDNE